MINTATPVASFGSEIRETAHILVDPEVSTVLALPKNNLNLKHLLQICDELDLGSKNFLQEIVHSGDKK